MKDFPLPHPMIPEIVDKLDAIFQDDSLPDGLMQSDVLLADSIHHAHIHLYLLCEQKGGIAHITDDDVNRAVDFFKEILKGELATRQGQIATETH